jgi:hypothetical protein
MSYYTVKKVEKKVKITVVLAISLMTVGALMMVQPAFAEDEIVDAGEDAEGGWLCWRPRCRLTALIYILRNGVPAEIIGEVIALEGRILVVEGGGGLVNVNLPWKWMVDGEVYTAQDLFDGEPFGVGDGIAIDSLMLEIEKESHTVTAYFAYEMDIRGTTATAVLPFNIRA